MGVFSNKTVRHERVWLIVLAVLFVFVVSWGVAQKSYPSVGVLTLRIWPWYLIIGLGFAVLPTVRKIIAQLIGGAYRTIQSANIDLTANDQRPEKKKIKTTLHESRLARWPIFGKLFRWARAEGWKFSLGLLAIFCIGLFLRMHQLGTLAPAGDEYRHLMAMKHFLADGHYDYTDSHFVTYILIIIKKITGTDSLLAYRLPFALMGSASILLLYGIGKKLNKTIGLLAAYLFAVMPLTVGLARYIRGYELEMFTAILCLYIYVSRPFRRKPWLWFPVMSAALFGLSHINHNAQYTATVYILIIFSGVSTGIFLLERQIKDAGLRNKITPILLILGYIATILFIPVITVFHKFMKMETGYLYILNYSNSFVTWYFPFIPYIVIIIILICAVFNKKSFWLTAPLLFTIAMVLFFYLFYFDAPSRFQVRYIYVIFPYLILLLAAGSHMFFKIVGAYFRDKRRNLITVVCFIMFFIIFNPAKAAYYTLTVQNGEIDEGLQFIRQDHHVLLEYLREHQIDVSRVLTSVPGTLHYYFDRPFANTIGDKNKYLLYPKDQDFELFDKEQIYSINGFWNKQETNKIKSALRNENIDYLIFSIPSRSTEYQTYSQLLMKNIPGLELIDTLSEDKSYGYIIYKVIR